MFRVFESFCFMGGAKDIFLNIGGAYDISECRAQANLFRKAPGDDFAWDLMDLTGPRFGTHCGSLGLFGVILRVSTGLVEFILGFAEFSVDVLLSSSMEYVDFIL